MIKAIVTIFAGIFGGQLFGYLYTGRVLDWWDYLHPYVVCVGVVLFVYGAFQVAESGWRPLFRVARLEQPGFDIFSCKYSRFNLSDDALKEAYVEFSSCGVALHIGWKKMYEETEA